METSNVTKVKIDSANDQLVENTFNKKIDKNYLNTKKFVFVSICIIISIVLIVLTIIYALKINFIEFFSQLTTAFQTNQLAPVWIVLLLLYIPFKMYMQATVYLCRIRKLGVKVPFWNALLYTLTLCFLSAISPANFLTDPYNAFWLRTHNIEMHKCSAITLCTMLIWHSTQLVVTLPSFIIVCTQYNSFVTSPVQGSIIVFWFVIVGLSVDLICLGVLIISGVSKRIHMWISLLWNAIKKKIRMPYLTKHEVINKYMNQAMMQKEFKKHFCDAYLTAYCAIVILLHEIFFYFTVIFAIKLLADPSLQINVFGLFNAANVATTANKFIPIPGGEFTSEKFLSVFTQVLGGISAPQDQIERLVNNSVLIWRFDTTYLPSFIGIFGFVIYLSDYISRTVKKRKLIKHKHELEANSGLHFEGEKNENGAMKIEMETNKIRTRYAPSPTGYFHIGGARTALFNYLYAKHMNGDFIVRIEDTDVERNVEGGIESQLENLKWMGIIPDESVMNPGKYGPYVQSQKLEHYKNLAFELVKNKKAYYCFCSAEQLETDRQLALSNHQTPKYNRRCYALSEDEVTKKIKQGIPFVIRLKMEDNVNIEWDDLIRGHMSVPTSALTDPVILKSNGYPMYNFAVVVDDYDMKITHVLRGEEHISNTPYQIAIKKALGYDKQDIKYGHLSIITDETGKKLSKRNKELKQFIEDYRTMGVPYEALNNFLALLGWSSKSNHEVLNSAELIAEFDLDRVSKAPAFFDFKKLLWMSNQYIKVMSDEAYIQFVSQYLKTNLNTICAPEYHNLLLCMFKPQLQYGQQIDELILDIFGNIKSQILSPELKAFIELESSKKVLNNFKKQLEQIDVINLDNATEIVNKIKVEENVKGKELFLPIRIACIFKEHGPEINKTMTIIGKQRILENITKLIG